MIRVTTPGLRSRVALIVTIPFLVVVAMLVYAFDSDRDAQLAHARERVLGEARALASEQRTALGVLRQFLASTAVLPELHGHAAEGSCDRALAGRHPADASLAHLVIARPDGNVLCQSGHAPPVWTVRDLALFRRVLAVQDTLVGSYADVWGDGAPPMALAMPARRGGDVVAVLIAAISPRLLERTFAASGLPPDATVTMLDESGVVVAHYPAAMPGRPAEPFPLPDRAALLRGDVTLDATGPDAVRRIHGYATLVDDAGPPLYLAVGLPRDAVVGPVERSFLLRLGITLGLLSLMFAYVASSASRIAFGPRRCSDGASAISPRAASWATTWSSSTRPASSASTPTSSPAASRSGRASASRAGSSSAAAATRGTRPSRTCTSTCRTRPIRSPAWGCRSPSTRCS